MTPQRSSSTVMIGACEDCLLAFTPQKQMICALLSRQIIGVWPYGSLRNYWGGKDHFGFFAGRRAPRGEGEFKFTTQQGEEIFKMLEKLIKGISVNPVVPSLPTESTQGNVQVQVDDSETKNTASNSRTVNSEVPVQTTSSRFRKRISNSLRSVSPSLSNNGKASRTSASNAQAVTAFLSPHTVSDVGKQPNVPITLSTSISSLSPTLHQYQHSRRRTLPAPPTLPKRLDGPDIDDTYSHTAHYLPVQFSRNSSLRIVAEGNNSIYNGLVRSESVRSNYVMHGSRAVANADSTSPVDNDGMSTYGLAYKPSFQKPQVLMPVLDGDYGSVGDVRKQQRELEEKKLLEATNRSAKLLTEGRRETHEGQVESTDGRSGGEGSVQGGGDDIGVREDDSDSFTKNLTYDSKDSIFSDKISDVASSISREGSLKHKDGGVEDSRVGQQEMDMILNPVYGDHHPPNLRPCPAPNKACVSTLSSIKVTGTACDAEPKEVQHATTEGPVSPLEDTPLDNDKKKLKDISKCEKSMKTISKKGSEFAIAPGHESTSPDHAQQKLLPSSMDGAMACTGTTPASVTQDLLSNSVEVVSCNDHTHIKDAAVCHRNAQDYSKVNKTVSGNCKENDEDELAPPLPPRKYSDVD